MAGKWEDRKVEGSRFIVEFSSRAQELGFGGELSLMVERTDSILREKGKENKSI